MGLVAVTCTPQKLQRPVIKVGKPYTLFDFFGFTGCLKDSTMTNWWMTSEKLGYINNDFLHETINQLPFKESQIRVVITWNNVTQEKDHLDLSYCGHMCSHDPQPLS